MRFPFLPTRWLSFGILGFSVILRWDNQSPVESRKTYSESHLRFPLRLLPTKFYFFTSLICVTFQVYKLPIYWYTLLLIMTKLLFLEHFQEWKVLKFEMGMHRMMMKKDFTREPETTRAHSSSFICFVSTDHSKIC